MTLFPLSIEPLLDHDCASFSCGVAELDDYIHHRARQDARRKVAAPFVLVDDHRTIVGYYTLSAYGVSPAELPPELARKLPKYPLIPATLLGRLAVADGYQGRQLGRMLLIDALYRSWKNTAEVASTGVVAEAINEKAHSFYVRYGFIELAERPNKLFLPMQIIRKVLSDT